MAETMDSLFRRGMISSKQMKKLGKSSAPKGLRKTKVERPNEEDFSGKQGLRDQGAGKMRGVKSAAAIDQKQAKGSSASPPPSKGGSVESRGCAPGVNEINKNSKTWPSVGKASAKTPMNPRSRGKIAKQGPQYGGGGRDTQ
jgi:hypothetical protein